MASSISASPLIGDSGTPGHSHQIAARERFPLAAAVRALITFSLAGASLGLFVGTLSVGSGAGLRFKSLRISYDRC